MVNSICEVLDKAINKQVKSEKTKDKYKKLRVT